MDSSVLVAMFSFFGVVVMALGTFLAAILTNRTEKTKTAENTIEGMLRERIVLRDEQINELKQDIEDLKEIVAAKDLVIRELREGGVNERGPG